MNNEQHLCDYGCGQIAKYIMSNNKRCCSKHYNSCPKIIEGKVGKKRSKESIKKMSISHIGQKAWNKGLNNIYSEETKSKMGTQLYGEDNPFFGKHHSKESKKIMSEKKKGKSSHMLGKKHSKETCKKISKANTGRVMSIEEIVLRKSGIKYYKDKYPTFAKIEEMRYNPDKPDEKEIQVHCKNHNCPNSKEKSGWFTPSWNQFHQRKLAIENPKGNQAGYFYCCDNCKEDCPLYNKKTTQLIKQDQINAGYIKEELYTNEEYNTWRNEVFNRNGYYCEYCDEKGTHVHHSRPQKLEPGFVLDPDSGVVCCEKCHYKYGHKTGTECSTGNLASTICR